MLSREDLQAGRLLARLTCDELAQRCALTVWEVFHAERQAEDRSDLVAGTIRRRLELEGVEFESPGVIRHLDGRLAPTFKAVGFMRGERLKRARNALGLTRLEVAHLARIGDGTLARLEKQGNLKLTASVYAAVGVLQLAGYQFAKRWRDKALVPRKKVARSILEATGDFPVTMLNGRPTLGHGNMGLDVLGLDLEDDD